jgi:hypothetical protein
MTPTLTIHLAGAKAPIFAGLDVRAEARTYLRDKGGAWGEDGAWDMGFVAGISLDLRWSPTPCCCRP